MPIKIIKKTNAALPPDNGSRTPTGPPLRRPSTRPRVVEDADAAALFQKYDYDANITSRIPSLSRMGIDAEGVRKSGKTNLLMGNPHAVVAKLYDGSPIGQRVRAKVHAINNLATLNEFIDDWISYGAAHPDSDLHTLVIDPTITWVEWLCSELVDEWNAELLRKYEKEKEYGGADAAAPILYKAMSDIKVGGQWGRIGAIVQRTLTRIGSIGWGWGMATHYKMKPVYGDGTGPKGAEWTSDTAPTVANIVSGMADLLIVTRRTSGMFFLEFTDEGSKKSDAAKGMSDTTLASRIPLYGSVEVPNYAGDPGAVAWDCLDAAFEEAKTRAAAIESEWTGR